MRESREVIIVNKETCERKKFGSIYAAADFLGAKYPNVVNAIYTGHAANGWYVYDTPEKIRERIQELENQIKMLEEEK